MCLVWPQPLHVISMIKKTCFEKPGQFWPSTEHPLPPRERLATGPWIEYSADRNTFYTDAALRQLCITRGSVDSKFLQCLFFNHVVKAAEMFDKGGMNNTVTRASVWLWWHCRHWISRKFQRLRGMTYHSLITWQSVQPVSIWGSACSWFMLLRISVTSRLLKRLHWFGIRSYKASMRL